MANDVFANDLEIACKRADGKSKTCFPDPCFTPPSPSAGWILIPYANTAYAKHTSNGSKTVFISGQQIMKKDISYFRKSTGNEPAAGPKGQFSGVKKGKAYFTSWSMNVKVEGKNVDRHTDGMTHNHGSKSGNAGPWYYADSKVVGSACDKEKKKAKQKCGKGNNWKKHCSNKKKPKNKDEFEKGKDKQKGDLKKKISAAENKIKNITSKIDGFTDKIAKESAKKAAAVAAKAGLKGWLGPVGWAWTAYDVASAGVEIYGMYEEFDSIKDELKKVTDDLKNSLQEASNLEAGFMDPYATNKCISARRCFLHPHDKKGVGDAGACCGTQQSHHLIPDAVMRTGTRSKSAKSQLSGCSGYNISKAPGVCAEGAGGGASTHGALHRKFLSDATKGVDSNGDLSIGKAKSAAASSHKATFPMSNCSSKCINAQMDAYYDKACGKNSDFKVNPKTGMNAKDLEGARPYSPTRN